MRDLVLAAFVFGSLPFILKRPWYGALLFAWMSIMNPHRLTWGFAHDYPFAQLIALTTLAGMVFTRNPKHMPLKPATLTLFLMVVWMCVTTLFALDPVSSVDQWNKVIKIQLMVFVTMYLLHSKEHIHYLICVVAGSVAYFGVKGGVFTVMGGGEHTVYGPEGFIAENNALALATIMTIPLLRYIQLQVKNKWVSRALLGSMVACGFSALGSQSRGALIAIAAMLMFLWFKSRNKAMTGMLLILLVPMALAFMPDAWEKRMNTIQTYEEDGSAMGRINAWQMAFNMAKDRPLVGGGFESYGPSQFAKYAPNPNDVHAWHSIYFTMLGEHGFVGLGLFLLLWFLAWGNANWIKRHTDKREGWRWASDLASMVQVSLVGYATGGAFLSLAYFDAPYYLLVAVVLTRVLVEKTIKAETDEATRRKVEALRQRPVPAPAPEARAPAGRPAPGPVLGPARGQTARPPQGGLVR